MKHLIINADDFGLSPGVNRGIIEAYQAEGISSTTLMVNMPGFADAVRLAGLHPELGVGLHVNLTYGRPISDPRLVPSLVQADGQFLPASEIYYRELRDIETELSAQWERFIATGLRPTHLDAHHHLHQIFPNVYEAMARLAVKEGIPMRRLQKPQVRSGNAALLPLTTKQVLLDTYEGDNGLQKLLYYLRNLQHGSTEIMCHPGYVDEPLRVISTLTKEREAELAVFRNPAISRAIRALGIRLIHYGMLGSVENRFDLAQTEAVPHEDTIPPVVPLQPLTPKRTLTQRKKPGNRKLKSSSLAWRKQRRPALPRKKPRVAARKKKRTLKPQHSRTY
ncbi:chitin disaccharide deacetylase [Paenibacillus sp. CAA11]|uniref:carbohydrate deacetylase n=1 Tax=Paenibacillus sp. CAA11 TaxID=1532905 RepID=UPI000D35D2F4|nr:carbohydrate deacetylase [Paenibacillus sp. CAA11]AWB46642.1 chitin disaccharide deacetylase [Paenibacillus sp. CAA11]